MKKIVYILIVALCISSCKESPYFFYESENRVQLVDSEDLTYSFYFEPETVTEGTAYIDVQMIGLPKTTPQKITLEQITEFYTTYTYDADGAIADSVVHERMNKGVVGTHYVSLDDVKVKDKLIIPANQYTAKIPIILKRDQSLKDGDVRICFKIKATDDLLLGDHDFIQKTIILTLELAEPTNWAQHIFGNYSKGKHLFMIDVVSKHEGKPIRIDDEWMASVSNTGQGLGAFWKAKLKTELQLFNTDKANLESGAAPLKADPNDPKSEIVAF